MKSIPFDSRPSRLRSRHTEPAVRKREVHDYELSRNQGINAKSTINGHALIYHGTWYLTSSMQCTHAEVSLGDQAAADRDGIGGYGLCAPTLGLWSAPPLSLGLSR